MKIKKGDLVKYKDWFNENQRKWRGIVISELSDHTSLVMVFWYKSHNKKCPRFREKIKYLKVLDKASVTERNDL